MKEQQELRLYTQHARGDKQPELTLYCQHINGDKQPELKLSINLRFAARAHAGVTTRTFRMQTDESVDTTTL